MRFHIHIHRGSGYSYSLAKLSSFAKEWEKPLIEKVEDELTLLRREAFHLNRVLLSLRHAQDFAIQMENIIKLEAL